MPVRFLLGAPGAGKTRRTLEAITEARTPGAPLAPIWVITPGRLAVAAYRQQLGRAGGGLAIHVGTFGDLFEDVLLRAGRLAPVAPLAVQRVILRRAVSRLVVSGKLAVYRDLAARPGFLEAAAGAIAECGEAGIGPGQVTSTAASFGEWLAELALIQSAYLEDMAAAGWDDTHSLNARACAELEGNPGLLVDVALLIVDGFDSFEGDQRRALRVLAESIDELWITLPGAQGMPRPAHRRFARSLEQLRQAGVTGEIVSLEAAPHVHPSLAELESKLFERHPAAVESAARWELIEARSPAEEAREALRWVKARVLRDGLRPGDCALVTPDPARYRPLLRRAAMEFGVPLRFTHGEPLVKAPAVVALLDLLSLPLLDWPQRLTLEAIHSPYFDLAPWELTPSDRAALESVSRYSVVVGGLEIWLESLDRLASAHTGDPAMDEDDGPPEDVPRGDDARRLARALRSLSSRLSPPAALAPVWWVAWLEDLMSDIRFGELQATGRDRAALESLRGVLRAVVAGELGEGSKSVPLGSFVGDLKILLEGTDFEERSDWNRPPVTVLQLLEARGVRYKAVAVLGLAEGVLPQIEREDPFLPEQVRSALGLELRLGREQTGLFYQAVTRADGWLLLTRPYLADDGEAWQPSPYWRMVADLAPGVVRRVTAEAPRPLPEAASVQEILFWGVRRGGLPKHYLADLGQAWIELKRAGEILEARTAAEPRGPHEGDLGAGAPALAEAYGDDHTWSPSRLETYATCPHQFLFSQVLRLEARQAPEPGYDVAQLGSILHEILERAYRQADDPGEAGSVQAALAPAAREVFGSAPDRYGFRPTPLWEAEQADLILALLTTVEALSERDPAWRPVGLEQAFGIAGNPALVFETEAGTVRLRGFIDRVDRNSAGQLCVIDYKTGSSHLTPADLESGRRLQLPLYALGARDALGLGEPVDGFYWKILQAQPGSLRLESFKTELDGEAAGGPEAAYQIAYRHVGRIVTGIRAGVFPPVPPAGGCPSYCPAVAWCWRYQPSGWGG